MSPRHIDRRTCYQLSSRKLDAHSVIKWTVVGQQSWQCLRAPTLDRCNLSQRSSSSVYSMILSRGSTISDSWYLLITNTLSADLTRVSLLTTAYNRQTDHVNPSTVAVGRVHIMHATSLAILKWHRAPRGLAATAKHNAGEQVRPWALCGQSYNFDQLHQPRDLLTVTSAAVLIRPSDFEWTLFKKNSQL